MHAIFTLNALLHCSTNFQLLKVIQLLKFKKIINEVVEITFH